ncbi:MFS transporter [Caldimonas thermodepolymerans]|jgi:Arabinose efflux permease|uniref:MFS family arabinose efflux permease n=1 Tax=Caldimonas thermodepolymerans TaxID=215580 RepID=A0A2S5T1V2_9BURK|nr:MFS transporter [Caldimonas thermodepolymerans]PPE68953.1 MFS transporter [Caldimonas thermodepolymerans]QPC30074.1 MFS transporter [Caldimonas thermodepolymerans]RDI00448.1 putative MFS family arabinose efflux permease [Caldimonas thermodepolymerans]TCP07273.1 putative MFS family arabinose efflux permease [Caldimonas thermodepolymerans]UZG42826.1 MFS transporter [Caldimonas thermodepolymerans]
MATTATPNPVPLRQDARTIGLIGVAHGTSHFFHMLLPPLFPWFISDFSLSYSELGLLVTLFFVISGVGQALSGFLVDKVGARPVLFVALCCFVGAGLAAASAQGYVGLMLASALAGFGNAPFHPVDFTILNKRVSAPRLGHAFSVHGITGNLGWALAPVFLVGITQATGSWRLACAGAALVAVAVLVLLLLNRDAVDDSVGAWAHEKKGAGGQSAAVAEHPLAFLKLPSVWLCFSFFFWSTCALSAVQSFASPSLQQLYGLPLSITSMVVTGYMLCGAAGMIIGGFLVARVERLEFTIGVALLVGAALLTLAGSGLVPGVAAAVIAALAGFGIGLAGPSRDMLIKRAAPPGATGRVYGTVYSGLDLGFAVASPTFGMLLDRGLPDWVFYGSALTLVMGVLSATLVSHQQRARTASAAAAA